MRVRAERRTHSAIGLVCDGVGVCIVSVQWQTNKREMVYGSHG